MSSSQLRKSAVASLIEAPTPSLLDVGCGPVGPGYFYADLARRITAIDWNLRVDGPLPEHVTPLSGDFLAHDFGDERFATIVCSDVFEHVQLEQEGAFAAKCAALLEPGGSLVITVPQAGTFAWMDPYRIKPALHHAAHRLGLYRSLHNGFCDIRKGHKHYRPDELAERFAPLVPRQRQQWGYLYEPLSVWVDAVSHKLGRQQGAAWLKRRAADETGYGDRSYNLAVRFAHPEGAGG
jgi:2-polyprenyl-3-methyl-5-hydroxy-6-metoxy-1,4-benzoquinol methylase